MMFLILLVPIAILGALVAIMCWRVKQRQVAMIMVGISLVCSVLSLVIILAGVFFADVLTAPMVG